MESIDLLVICCPECENFENLEVTEEETMICHECSTEFDLDNIAATQVTVEVM
jgi:uncharacterized protein YbaR (Trm112 family)